MAGSKTIKVRFDGDKSGLDRAAKASEGTVTRWRARVSKGVALAGKMASVAAAISGAVIGGIMGAALASALAAGVVLALGGGFLAAGIAGAASDPGVKKAFGGLGAQAQSALKDFSAPFRGPLIRAAKTFGDALKRMQPTINAIGRQLAPVIDKLAPALAQMAENALPGIAAGAAKSAPILEKLVGFLPQIGTWIGQLVTKITEFSTWAATNADTIRAWIEVLGPLVAIFGGIVLAIKAWIAVQTILNVVMSINPIALIVIAIAALIAIIVLIATKTRFFQTIWAAVWGFFKAVGAWFAGPFANFFVMVWNKIVAGAQWVWAKVSAYFGFWYGLFETVKGWLGAAKDWLVAKFNQVVDYVAALPARVGRAAAGLWNGIKDSFRNAINWVIDKWNALSFTLPSINVPGLGSISGYTLSTPDIGRLASGGHMTPGRTYLTGENGIEAITAGRTGGYVHSAGDTAAMMGPPEVHVYIGDRELTDIVDVRITSRDRQLKRRAGTRAGALA